MHLGRRGRNGTPTRGEIQKSVPAKVDSRRRRGNQKFTDMGLAHEIAFCEEEPEEGLHRQETTDNPVFDSDVINIMS